MTTSRDPIYAGHRYPAEIISYAIWLYFRFPLSLRMVEEMLAARGICVTHETSDCPCQTAAEIGGGRRSERTGNADANPQRHGLHAIAQGWIGSVGSQR